MRETIATEKTLLYPLDEPKAYAWRANSLPIQKSTEKNSVFRLRAVYSQNLILLKFSCSNNLQTSYNKNRFGTKAFVLTSLFNIEIR